MSKIAEIKALEAYPTPLDNEPFISKGFVEEKNREGFIKGYDQAMQDFIEKAEKWLEPTFKRIAGYYCGGDLMNDFEKYMEEEL